MKLSEAEAWLRGERSTANTVPIEPHETWIVKGADRDRSGMMPEFIAWAFVVAFGAGSVILLAGSGHTGLAWGSTLSAAAFLAGFWYLPSRADRDLPEWLLTLCGAAGWLTCWVWSLKP